jgi:hypothetical protein
MRVFGTVLMVLGFIVGLGPIAVFFFIGALPSMFSPNTAMAWHYISAFGVIVYGPVGYLLYRLGKWARSTEPAS